MDKRKEMEDNLAVLYHYWIKGRLSDQEYEEKRSALIRRHLRADNCGETS